MSNIRIRIWSEYNRNLLQRPLTTKASIAAFIFFTSDTATQLMPSPVSSSNSTALSDWNASRALSGAGFGIVATTWLHYWWGCLEWLVESRIPAARYRLANAVVKVVIDQSLAAPLYIYSYFVLTNTGQKLKLIDGSLPEAWQVWKETNDKAAAMLLPTMLQHWTLWPMVHTLNFYFMPLHHRVLVQNTVLIGWSGYLSHLNHQTTVLMTPTEEAHVAIQRRETLRQDIKQRQSS
jgi:protein Mpv17